MQSRQSAVRSAPAGVPLVAVWECLGAVRWVPSVFGIVLSPERCRSTAFLLGQSSYRGARQSRLVLLARKTEGELARLGSSCYRTVPTAYAHEAQELNRTSSASPRRLARATQRRVTPPATTQRQNIHRGAVKPENWGSNLLESTSAKSKHST